MINNLLQHYQEIINARFNLIKAKYLHSGNKGRYGEIILNEFLNEYLPNDILISHGEIIDSLENHSGQIDIIMADKNQQPFVYDYRVPNIFIIEAVTGAGEVKFTLNDIDELIKKCSQFKQLSPKSLNGEIICTNEYDQKRFYEKRPFFVFAYNSELTIPTIIKRLNEHYKDSPITEQIDAIFIADRGAIINFGNGKGSFGYKYKDKGKEIIATKYVNICDQNKVLKHFVIWLTCVMPKKLNFINPIINYLF